MPGETSHDVVMVSREKVRSGIVDDQRRTRHC